MKAANRVLSVGTGWPIFHSFKPDAGSGIKRDIVLQFLYIPKNRGLDCQIMLLVEKASDILNSFLRYHTGNKLLTIPEYIVTL